MQTYCKNTNITFMESLDTDWCQLPAILGYIINDVANERRGFELFVRNIKKDVNPNQDYYIFGGADRIHSFIKTVREEIQTKQFIYNFSELLLFRITNKELRNKYREIIYNFFQNEAVFDFEYSVVENGTYVYPMIPACQFNGPAWIGQLIDTQIMYLANGITGYNTFKQFNDDSILDEKLKVLTATEKELNVMYPTKEGQEIVTEIQNEYFDVLEERALDYKEATKDTPIMEAAKRRAASLYVGVMASSIAINVGQWQGTSNIGAFFANLVPLEKLGGTMMHAFVMSFKQEIDAFRVWGEIFPDMNINIIDTYDSVKAVKSMIKYNVKPQIVRIDSSPLKTLALDVRAILDEAGWADVLIYLSGDIKPEFLNEMREEGIPFDRTMAGTKYVHINDSEKINAGFVYKVVEFEKDGEVYFPEKKASNKSNYPGLKRFEYEPDKNELIVKVSVDDGNPITNLEKLSYVNEKTSILFNTED